MPEPETPYTPTTEDRPLSETMKLHWFGPQRCACGVIHLKPRGPAE